MRKLTGDSGPGSTGGGTGTGGGGGGGGGPPLKPTEGEGRPQRVHQDDLLGFATLPPDVIAALLALRAQYQHTPDGDQAYAQAAIALVRGTAWYAQTFPGIKEARALGIIGTDLGSEQQYRQMYLRYNQLYQQYYGRNLTWDEAYRLFSTGADPTTVQQHFQGAAYISANRPDIQYLYGAFGEGGQGAGGTLSASQLTAFGDETAGFDTALGQKLTTRFQSALARYQRVFQGTLATASLGIGGAGLKADSLLATKTSPDVQA